MARKVLVFNFFAGIFHRGIPLYVDNLCVGMEREGVRMTQFRCPRFLHRRPRWLINLVYVFCEQLVMPLASLAYWRTIHPSNSVSILSSIFGRPLLIVHDFIPNRLGNKAFAARYIRATQRIHDCCGGDVAYISRGNQRTARLTHRFTRSRTYIFPNAFFRFAELRSAVAPARENYVLLCSGWGKNKDLEGALTLYWRSKLYERRSLQILGLQGVQDRVTAFCALHPELAGRVSVLPKVDDAVVVASYEKAAWVWVHSLQEGFGRSIAEARLCGCRVAATNIPPFREQRDAAVTLYSGLDEFERAVAACEDAGDRPSAGNPPEQVLLMAEIHRYLQEA
jgi:glycosyltransferase involved in cell wall biosynthesis